MHLEGKIHQGFLKLKNEVETLRIRLEIIDQKMDRDKEKKETTAIKQEGNEEPASAVQPPEDDRPRDHSHSKKKKHKEHKEHKHKDKDRRDSR